jgi:hypothetical protein
MSFQKKQNTHELKTNKPHRTDRENLNKRQRMKLLKQQRTMMACKNGLRIVPLLLLFPLTLSEWIQQQSSVASYQMSRKLVDMEDASCVPQRRGGGQPSRDEEENERRWHSLMTFCRGNWSGSIGWFDVKEGNTLQPRPDNFQRNMRLSFLPSHQHSEVANWVVYHARVQGLREEVVIPKYRDENEDASLSDAQQFYAFKEGILGRTGKDFSRLPVIEHGFWDEGMRRTVVLVYNQARLSNICFLQQSKQMTTSLMLPQRIRRTFRSYPRHTK